MDTKTYVGVTTTIFLIIAILHLARALLGWQVSIAGWMVPSWFSWFGFIVAGFMGYFGYTINKQS